MTSDVTPAPAKPAPPAEPLYYEVWFRAPGDRWRRIGRAGTHAEAVTLCGSKGDWSIRPVYPTDSASKPSLFDEVQECAQ